MIQFTFQNLEELMQFIQLFQSQTTVMKAMEHTEPGNTEAQAPEADAQPASATPPQPETPPTVVPTTPIHYTLDDLAKASMTLMDTGRQSELQQLLAKFGVETLPSLPLEQYGSFATELRGLGAQI